MEKLFLKLDPGPFYGDKGRTKAAQWGIRDEH